MDVIKLVERAYEINKANGWHEEKRDWEELCLLMVSEVAEALEDYRGGKAPTEEWYTKKQGHVNGVPAEVTSYNYQPDETWKPCGIPSELADVLIRIADTAGLYNATEEFKKAVEDSLYTDILPDPEEAVMPNLSFPKNLNRIVRIIADASGREDSFGFDALGAAFQETLRLAEFCGIDIERAVNEKLAYNATRGHKHGGKVI